jgi:hypothetical protein
VQPDPLTDYRRSGLDHLKLAAEVILRLGREEAIPAPLEAELTLFRERVETALLRPGQDNPASDW